MQYAALFGVFFAFVGGSVHGKLVSESEECTSSEGTCHQPQGRKSTALLQSTDKLALNNWLQSDEDLSTQSDSISEVRTSGSSSTRTTMSRVAHAMVLAKQYEAHNRQLLESVAQSQAALPASNDELDKLISDFIDENEPEKDHCTARILEAKHQLNLLHSTVIDLTMEMNVTEIDIQATTTQIATLTEEQAKIDKECAEEIEKCKKEKKENEEMWIKLKEELHILYQIANPSVSRSSHEIWNAASSTINYESHSSTSIKSTSNLTTTNTTTESSLLQMANERLARPHSTSMVGVQGARELVEKTKTLAQDLATCMSQSQESLTPQSQESLTQVTMGRQPGCVRVLNGTIFHDGGFYTPDGETQKVEVAPGEKAEKDGLFCMALETCEAGSDVEVTVGGVTKKIQLPNQLVTGNVTAIQCSTINPDFRGLLVVMCNGTNVMVPDASHCVKTSSNTTACKRQLEYLELTYVKAYVELTRLVSYYEVLINSTTCEDTVNQKCAEKKQPGLSKLETLISKLSTYTEKLTQLKLRIEIAMRTETQLRSHVAVLHSKCHEIDVTSIALGKVRDVIHVLGVCPGLGRPEFHIPQWAGNFTRVWWTKTMTDADLDAAMDQACADMPHEDGATLRAAEASEVALRTIEGSPLTNTDLEHVTVQLIGKCSPSTADDNIHRVGTDAGLCQGAVDTDETEQPHPSGHARRCWDPDVEFSTQSMSDCNFGHKSVMCVVDRGNIRNVSDPI